MRVLSRIARPCPTECTRRRCAPPSGSTPRVQDKELFPLYVDRFPIQLLAFLRFARIQDVAQVASTAFDRDVIISPLNEYEVLQLVMGDLRERLQEYLDNQVCARCDE